MIRATQEYGTLADRLPPHNLEAEVGVLGSILVDAAALHEVMPVLRADDFYRECHEQVYRAICDLADGGGAVDAVTLCDELERRKARPPHEGPLAWLEVITDLANGVPHAANARYYADIVRQKAETRRLIQAHNEGLRRCYSNEYTAEQLVSASQAEFLSIGDRGASTEVTLGEAVREALARVRRRLDGEELGIATPFRLLNDAIGGLHPGRLYVVAGRPGSGKSALLFGLAEHAARQGVPCQVFSLEMAAVELAERYLAATADVNGYGLRKPHELDKPRLDALDAAGEDAHLLPVRIDDAGGLPVAQIAARARRCKHRHGLGLVLVDYLQLADGSSGRKETRQEEVARVSRGLKNLAKELNVPVVAAVQLNRAVENRPAAEQVPRMADLRESGQIEQDAHAILLLHAEAYPSETVTVDVAKNRDGTTGKFPLTFVRSRTRFEDFDANAGFVPPPADF